MQIITMGKFFRSFPFLPHPRIVKWKGLLPCVLLLSALHVQGCATTSDIMPPALPSEAKTLPSFSAASPTPSSSLFPDRRSPGSLWGPASNSYFQDIKARAVGDVVTITVSEESKAQNQANTKANKNQDYASSLTIQDPTLGGKSLMGGDTSLGWKGTFANKFQGQGSTDRSNSITAIMTATVVDIMPNGNMLIRGSRWTKVNEEYQQIVLEGVVRPSDVTRNNTVLSQNIADARIYVVGKGPVTQVQKPGWLSQLINYINPF